MRAWIVFGLMALAGSGAYGAPQIYGWAELGRLEPGGPVLRLKLDTGADTSSLDARRLREFEHQGERWVSFIVPSEGKGSKRPQERIEREVVRYVHVRGAGGSETRPVVRMAICVGERVFDDEFTLNDRSKMTYPVLLGRNTLRQMGAAVDVNRTFTIDPHCP
ncbi:ATP-dependent zinc protease family protein [Aeromonas simiae]|uniref:ATP-dependent zinc protease n=1 Tax=Aeromonas simiae TaxID=218936 RepID=A0A5J6WZZ8_9GAMM|nr:ATP-dependent zinc protease [Aeromonas simiae]MDO2948825.1 ATP-dependent zinc protease [Aeromonas simiae]MDO2956208.1 ATP-dependent zinc protease [Aeromonas simiae]QFI54895.1 ATP-dependent zinc protease [Aeromonas simiae]